jgi:hypothetical protein
MREPQEIEDREGELAVAGSRRWMWRRRAASIPAGAVRIPPEQIRLGVGGQRGEPKQVSYFDTPATDRTPRTCSHTDTTVAERSDGTPAVRGMRMRFGSCASGRATGG